MGMEYWSVQGYGIQIDELYDYFSHTIKEELDDMDYMDLFSQKAADSCDVVLGYTGDFYNQPYTYLMIHYPYNVSKDGKHIHSYSEAEANEILYNFLKPHMNEDFTLEVVSQNADYVDEIGCG